jgi:hypothetical protein
MREKILIFIYYTWWIWVLVLGFIIKYKIAVSDLPEWFKFTLLK